MDIKRLILLVIASEALIHLFLHAAPIQSMRRWMIKMTPFLYSKEQETHLLDCGYCISIWTGFFMAFLYFLDCIIVTYFIYALVIGRLSNHFHMIFSIIRDKQLDIRINRSKNADR